MSGDKGTAEKVPSGTQPPLNLYTMFNVSQKVKAEPLAVTQETTNVGITTRHWGSDEESDELKLVEEPVETTTDVSIEPGPEKQDSEGDDEEDDQSDDESVKSFISLRDTDEIYDVGLEDMVNVAPVRVGQCCSYLTHKSNPQNAVMCVSRCANYSSSDCVVSSLRSFVKYVNDCYAVLGENESIGILDAFIRSRHEVLCRYLLKSISVDYESSDKRFCDVFPIGSRRTPDYIMDLDDGSKLIIEVTAVSDVDKAAKMKGDTDKGYISKYEPEINELKMLGITVYYKVLIFSMNEVNDMDYKSKINEIYGLLNRVVQNYALGVLEHIRRELIQTTREINKCLGKYYNCLYGAPYELKVDCSGELKYLFADGPNDYTKYYKRVRITNHIYDKMLSAWPRLFGFIQRQSDNLPYKLVYDVSTNKFNFCQEPGLKKYEWEDILLYEQYSTACLNLSVRASGRETQLGKAEVEYYSYEPCKTVKVFTSHDKEESHEGSYEEDCMLPIKDYSFNIKMNRFTQMSSIFQDEDYDLRLIKSITKMDTEWSTQSKFCQGMNTLIKPPLASYVLDEQRIRDSISRFELDYDMMNTGSVDKTVVYHLKQPFIYPLYKHPQSGYARLDYKNVGLMEAVMGMNIGDYTKMIIGSAINNKFEMGKRSDLVPKEITDLNLKLIQVQRDITSLIKEFMKSTTIRPIPKLRDIMGGQELINKLSETNKEMSESCKKLGYTPRKVPNIKMNMKNESIKTAFKHEMEHFKNRTEKSCHKGVGRLFSYDNLVIVFRDLQRTLLEYSNEPCTDELYSETIGEDASLLFELKNESVNRNKDFYKHLRNTNLYHSAAFISRLCYTLMFYSQTSDNGNICHFDNLGYRNVFIITKGGKKIYGTKKSRLFRLCYPCYTAVTGWYHNAIAPSDFMIFNCNGENYIMTPWMNFHETILTDGMTFLHRVMGFCMLNRIESNPIMLDLERCYFNILLAFHNRRQTESFLHNMRYVMMNSMSTITALENIVCEFAGFNYDCFQAYLRECVINTLPKFLIKMKWVHDHSTNKDFKSVLSSANIEHPFSNVLMKDMETLALGVYSTYIMSKAPTTQSLEQVHNLNRMLTTHKRYHEEAEGVNAVEKYAVVENGDFKKYYNDLFSSNFAFDPSYCVQLGKFMGDYLKCELGESIMNTKWESILNRSWDEMSNTKGLRYEGKDFFGNKGYYVVYDHVIKQNPDILKDLVKLTSTDEPPDKVLKSLNINNQTYRSKISNTEFDTAIFHVVDKKQRGGQREIFVMDYKTKLHQQPIENFMEFLCKSVNTEMISVPSNKRLHNVHHQVFERHSGVKDTQYWVLDCKRWAPESIVEKFVLFLTGMRNVLPASFMLHCYNFFALLSRKRIYTRPHIWGILKSSVRSKDFDHNWIVEDAERGGVYFTMQYSWVMGIFNYFSSLMHVACQLHTGHILRVTTLANYGYNFELHMLAHSDDSSGRSNAVNQHQLIRSVFIYETLMKAANHMISEKKSNIGSKYFEFLSILYLSGTLLSLLAKFTGIFNFHPSDSGYCQDICDVYSKMIELTMNGATFEQSYIAGKIQANLIHKFYFNKRITSDLYNLPPKMLGVPDCHPLMALICGSDADLLRLYLTRGPEYINKFIYLSENLVMGGECEEGLIKGFKTTPKVNLLKKLKILKDKIPDSTPDSWSIDNVNFHHTAFNAYQFLHKLSDKKFISSLQDESITRRISRAYYMSAHNTVPTTRGVLNYKKLRMLITTMLAYDDDEFLLQLGVTDKNQLDADKIKLNSTVSLTQKLIEYMFTEPLTLCKYMNSVKFNRDNIQAFTKTSKPVHFKVLKMTDAVSSDFSPSSMVSYMTEPKYKLFLPNTRGYENLTATIKDQLLSHGIHVSELTQSQLYSILNKIKSKSYSENYFYANVPHDLRTIESYQDVLTMMSHNSFEGQIITGISIPFASTISAPIQAYMPDMARPEVTWTLALYTVLPSLAKWSGGLEKLHELDVNLPYFLGKGIVKPLRLLEMLDHYWSANPKMLPYFKFNKNIAMCAIKGDLLLPSILEGTYYHSFVKKQFRVGNDWVGAGNLFINLDDIKLNFFILNSRILKVLTNKKEYLFSDSQIKYINIVLKNAPLLTLNEHLVESNVDHYNGICFGVNKTNNYYIGHARNLHWVMTAIEDTNCGTLLSVPQIGHLRHVHRNVLKWERYDEVTTTTSYNIIGLPTVASDSIGLLRDLIIPNDHNRILLSEEGNEIIGDNILLELCGDELEIPRQINMKTVIDNYESSRLYKLFYVLASRKVCKVENITLTRKVLPAPDGGILNALIEYARLDSNFKFKWNRVLTPEYMALKSSQPESFVSTLLTNINDKYNSLYDDEDKLTIIESLKNLSTHITSPDFQERLLKLMCTWGYVGVQGALASISCVDDVNSFNNFRIYPKNFAHHNYFVECLPLLINAVYQATLVAYSTTGVMCLQEIYNYPVKPDKLMSYLISYCHSITLTSYNKERLVMPFFINTHNTLMYGLLNNIFNCTQAMACMKDLLKHNMFMAYLPLGPEYINKWMGLTYSLKNSYIIVNNVSTNLDITVRNDMITEPPYVKTQKLVSALGVNLTTKLVRNYGAADNRLLGKFSQPIIHKYYNKWVRLSVGKIKYDSIKSVSLSGVHLPPHKLLMPDDMDDYEEEEPEKAELLSEYLMELKPIEVDMESIEDIEEQIKESELFDKTLIKKVKLSMKGKLINAHLHNFNILYLIGCDSKLGLINRLNGIGNEHIIVTDFYIPQLDCHNKEMYMRFRMREYGWEGGTGIKPVFILFYVKTTELKEVRFWETILGADEVQEKELTSVYTHLLPICCNDSGIECDYLSLRLGSSKDRDRDFQKNIDNMLALQAKASQTTKQLSAEELERLEKRRSYKEKIMNDYAATPEIVDKYLQTLEKLEDNKDKYVESLLDSIFNSSSDSNENLNRILTLKRTIDTVFMGPLSTNDYEQIFQVPKVFSENRTRSVARQLQCFKDMKVLAEYDAIAPGFLLKSLSGSLDITTEMLGRIDTKIRMWRYLAKGKDNTKENKNMLIDLFLMLVNDANVAVDSKLNAVWESVSARIDQYIMSDIGDDSTEEKSSRFQQPAVGELYYNAIPDIMPVKFED